MKQPVLAQRRKDVLCAGVHERKSTHLFIIIIVFIE